ncbi:uncharacterized protein DUF4189 [Rhizobium sp. PP-F2F-G38]|uniref:DUF4189 domain-containing protein n=1 Tax=Ferranicluibacter rubi TaxID=2715133 RepID=A0AA43ZGL1_9HYPH|nr:DUF4189 domain-containing protein [Ferranicluibacter rubi]PYE37032.1 uncharacterized protein DUF4189 [Rhizobium sp. PP-WC-1G-195]PYF00484.1 uncharacterized protein DUF4189 [Rhizobium sp. PP-F2F-G38]TCP90827.1 uncharacterized protein DUF4189 [Rhizobium sp. PP-CC-2G-626]TCQ09726.1 uncharacterized protein DUF4189 [Rhizobium sp. PP-F2F-G36]TCQ28190.1 uncharacterized protein DUF4189 [Rhizobium sp. PP-CC-3G-465]
MKTFIRIAFATTILLAGPVSSAFAFGAIAVNDEQGMAADEAGYGMGWGSSRKEAERNAVQECKSAGNDDCKVAVWFEQCGAYAGDRVNYGIGYGSTQKAAETMATKDCPNCKIVVSDCQ